MRAERHHRRPVLAKRQRRSRTQRPVMAPQMAAAVALHALVEAGEFIARGRRQYLVAHITPELMETISVGLAATEDEEDNGDLEPSIGTQEDLEGDGLDRELDICDDEPDQDLEPSGDEGDYSSYSRNVDDRRYIEAARARIQAKRKPTVITAPNGRRGVFVPVA